MQMTDQSRRKVYGFLYIVLCAVAVLPLLSNFAPERGDAGMWLARVDELLHALRNGSFLLFPSAETVIAHAGQYDALDSNLWLLFPAVLKLVTGNALFAYRLFMLLLQVGTLLCALSLFRRIFQKEETAFFATLFYLTAPYRLYVTYDGVNRGRSIAFMLLPLFVRLAFEVYTEKGKRKWLALIGGAVLWAGIAYGDWVVAFVLVAVMALGIVWYRKWNAILLPVAGIVLYLPGLRYVARYLIKGGMEQWNFPLNSIMPKGYSFGDFFAGLLYREDLPGLGLGLLGALMILVGMCYVKEHFQWNKKYNFAVFTAGALLLASCKFFPWDLVQRVGMPFVRMVSLWESPAVFFGCATLPLSVLGAYAMESLPGEGGAGKAMKAAVAVACAGVAVFLGSTYM